MRSKKELLMIFRYHVERYIPLYSRGLCTVLNNMGVFRVILSQEVDYLYELIHKNIPDPTYDDLYWWKPGELEPRLAFIDKLIAQCDESV